MSEVDTSSQPKALHQIQPSVFLHLDPSLAQLPARLSLGGAPSNAPILLSSDLEKAYLC